MTAEQNIKAIANDYGYMVTIQAFSFPTKYQINAIPCGGEGRCFSAYGSLERTSGKILKQIKQWCRAQNR